MTADDTRDRLRDDEITREIITPPRPVAPRFKTAEVMLKGEKKILNLIPYQLITFRLREREQTFFFIVGKVEANRVKMVFAYEHRTLDPEHLQEASFVFEGMKYSFVPAFMTGFSRRFIQNSQYFQSSVPSEIVKPSVRFTNDSLGSSDSLTIPPAAKMALVAEYYAIEGIIGAHEKSWIEEDKKKLGRER